RSVQRQIDHATDFATAHGWTVAASNLYVDDGISGAIFGTGRPGLTRLMDAASAGAFRVLIVSEVSRLGRELLETGFVLKQLSRNGVQVWSYLTGREIRLDTPTEKLMVAVENYASEQERVNARSRTRDALVRKAHNGHVTGGRCFGYDNVRVNNHVERVINE